MARKKIDVALYFSDTQWAVLLSMASSKLSSLDPLSRTELSVWKGLEAAASEALSILAVE